MAYDFYIRRKQDLIDAVQEFGIVPYFCTSVPGFSHKEHCHPSVLFSDNGDDTWAWRNITLRKSIWALILPQKSMRGSRRSPMRDCLNTLYICSRMCRCQI